MKVILSLICILFVSQLSHAEEPKKETDNKKIVYNVMDYGAVGDGITNDAAAIQSALDAAFIAGGGIVLLPESSNGFRIARDIRIKTNVTLTSKSKTTLHLENASIVTSPGYHRSVVIENLRIVGSHRKAACIKIDTDKAEAQADMIVSNNDFSGCSSAIYSAHWVQNAKVINNRFTDCNYGLYVHTIDNWQITDNRFMRPITRPIEVHNGHKNLVKGNVIDGDKKGTIIGILFMTNATLATDGPSNNIVTGNTVKHVAEEGIMMEEAVANAFKAGGTATGATARTLARTNAGWKPNGFRGRELVIVDGIGAGQWRNIVSNTDDTVTLDKDWDVLPDNTSKFTILKLMKGNVISNNIVEDTGRMGIEFYGPSADNVISGNTIRNGGTNKDYSGIAIVGTSGQGGKREARHPALNNKVIDNKIVGSAKSGVHIYVESFIKPDFVNRANIVERNTIAETVTGILIETSSNTIVQENNITAIEVGIREDYSADDSIISRNTIKNYKAADIVNAGRNLR